MFGLPLRMIKEMLNWRVSVDILLIALLIYFTYRTLRRLGTWKIVAGVFIAAVFFVVADILDLTGVTWIYSNFSHIAVIALIVIFQPELRKVFERAASLRRKEIGKEGAGLSMITADAVFALAEQKRGAIIVFPGKEPIQEWMSGGIALDADPSFPLIVSIFDPHSPGHDGALVVDNGKLTRFGVRLPLSRTKSLPEELGTRHHAAMGLSEVCDAFVVVVSEETGQVTTFYQGRFQKAEGRNDVVSRITFHWERTGSYTLPVLRGKKKWNHVWEIGFSIILAFAFWYTVIISQGELRERSLSVPIEYVASPAELALVGDKPAEVKLHLAGPKSDLDSMNPSQLSVQIDLSEAKPGKQTFVVAESDVKLPKRVRLLDAEPSSFELSLLEILQKEFVVKPQLVGRLPGDLKLVSIEVRPQKVRGFAPVAQGEEEDFTVMTTPVYLESIRENTRLFCKIIAPPSIQPTDKRWPDVEIVIRVDSNQQ